MAREVDSDARHRDATAALGKEVKSVGRAGMEGRAQLAGCRRSQPQQLLQGLGRQRPLSDDAHSLRDQRGETFALGSRSTAELGGDETRQQIEFTLGATRAQVPSTPGGTGARGVLTTALSAAIQDRVEAGEDQPQLGPCDLANAFKKNLSVERHDLRDVGDGVH